MDPPANNAALTGLESATATRLIGPIEVTGAAQVDEICRLRVAVWSESGQLAEDPFLQDEWRDELDARGRSRHWAILRGDEIVAAARLSLHDTLRDV
jgi:hypothetical protein